MKVVSNPDKDSDCRYLAVCLTEGFEVALTNDELSQILFSLCGESLSSAYFTALDMPIFHLLNFYAEFSEFCERRNSQQRAQQPTGKPQYTIDPITGEERQQ